MNGSGIGRTTSKLPFLCQACSNPGAGPFVTKVARSERSRSAAGCCSGEIDEPVERRDNARFIEGQSGPKTVARGFRWDSPTPSAATDGSTSMEGVGRLPCATYRWDGRTSGSVPCATPHPGLRVRSRRWPRRRTRPGVPTPSGASRRRGSPGRPGRPI